MLLPLFTSAWNSFPTHAEYPNMEALYSMLGGQAQEALQWGGFGPDGNTCASRMSVALNGAGTPISLAICKQINAATLSTSDGHHIIYRVRDLRAYLLDAFGRPDVDQTPPFDDDFAGKTGIMAWTVHGWSDASGHMCLFDGTSYREPDHDDVPAVYPNVTVIQSEFWRLP